MLGVVRDEILFQRIGGSRLPVEFRGPVPGVVDVDGILFPRLPRKPGANGRANVAPGRVLVEQERDVLGWKPAQLGIRQHGVDGLGVRPRKAQIPDGGIPVLVDPNDDRMPGVRRRLVVRPCGHPYVPRAGHCLPPEVPPCTKSYIKL